MTRQEFAYQIRKIILAQSKRAHVGHIGSALSVADMMAALYCGPLAHVSPDDPARPRLVLSKGHAALALYAALHLRGLMPAEQLDTYCADDSRLGVHPERELFGVDFATGSLGQGLSMGVGAALAATLSAGTPQAARPTFVLMSDAECNEGAVWEAAMFAAHHHLGNLTVLLDLNGQQAFGYTKDVLNIPNMAERWRAFGWTVSEVDGHDSAAIDSEFAITTAQPHLIICHTTFGKGVSYMQNQIKWHYWPMSDDEYAQAMHEIEATRP